MILVNIKMNALRDLKNVEPSNSKAAQNNKNVQYMSLVFKMKINKPKMNI